MVVKVEEKFEKTRDAKSKEYILRGEKNVKHYDRIQKKNKKKNIRKFHKNLNIQLQLIRKKTQLIGMCIRYTYSKLKAHQESVSQRLSKARTIPFKNCACGDYPPTACKI